jgi:hypothetical protein
MKMFIYYEDDDSSQWVEVSGSSGGGSAASGSTGGSGVTMESTDPLITTNGTLGELWLNTTSGELYACTDITTDANIWTNTGDGTGNIMPNDPPGNPTNTTIADQIHETSFNHIFTGGTDTDGTVTHYIVDQINNASLTVATAEIAAGSPHTFTIGTLSADVTFSFRVRSKDNSGAYSSGVTITFLGLLPVDPTGGFINHYTVGGINYRSHTFLTSGTFSVPASISGIDIFIVAGGGAGGEANANGGGGGAGGVIQGTGATLPAGDYTATVGAGGTGIPSANNSGSSGENTSFGSIWAPGGGYGASYYSIAADGGSGGGASRVKPYGGGYTSGTPGWNYGSYMTAHVNSGGNNIGSASTIDKFGGGGGGAGGAGGDGISGGAGGIGITNTFYDGTTMKYAGGGSGSRFNHTASRTHDNTTWGGGRGSEYADLGGYAYISTRDGVVNTGGGGGGSGDYPTGHLGGSGIIIVRYAI